MKSKITLVLLLTCMVTAALFAQGSWTLKASFPGTGRFDAVSFSVGTKGYFGTGNAGGYTADFWEWDQATNLWAQKANYPDTPRDRATGFSIGTKGYIACGYDLQWEDELWEYNPTTNTWVIRTPFANGLGRVSPVSFSIGNKGYVGMGYQNFHRQDIWEFDPMTNTWAQKANFGGPGRWHAVGFAIGGKGYVGTGDTALAGGQYGPKKDFWEYDPVANSWTRKADYGGPACSEATGFSIGTKGYIGTGYDKPAANGGVGPFNAFWEYNPTTDAWVQMTNFGGTARRGALGFSIGNFGYIGCGFDPIVSYFTDFWEFSTSGIGYEEMNAPLSGLSVYPNPVTEHSTISYNLNTSSIVSIELLDLTGKLISVLVNREKQAAGKQFVTVAGFAGKWIPGIYLLSVTTDKGERSVQKISVAG